ncbi:Plasma membrane sulfite pump involved in sulfite metabolism [Tulasnella sp. 403]|nr:Plasma membrane sulfite pump involved in sulfite metabolism [Tulasnella sp. 403]
MGFGVQITLFRLFPYDGGHRKVLDWFSTAFLIMNIILFLTLTALTVARYVLFPQLWRTMIHDPVQSMFLGCYPMALATIINGLVFEAVEKYRIGGCGFIYFIWSLWWLDVLLAVVSNLGMFYIMVTRHTYELATSSAVWLLPVVPTVVAGTTGAIVAGALTEVSQPYAYVTTIVTTSLLLMGITMSAAILALYIQRLIIHGFPTAGLSVSIFLPLGPLGQTGYGFLLVGDLLVKLLPQNTSPANYLAGDGVATALKAVCFAASCTLWMFGLWFLIPATIALATSRNVKFGIPWWGLVFPTLGNMLHSGFVKVLATIYTLLVLCLFTSILTKTLIALYDGTVFQAPSLGGQSPTPPIEEKEDAISTPRSPENGQTELSSPSMPPKKKSRSRVPEPEPDYEEEEPLVLPPASAEAAQDSEDDSITRCVCGSEDGELGGMMIQCETCKVWQHGICVGFHSEEDCPETYYCERCRPDQHETLLKSLKKSMGGHQRSASSNVMPPPSHDAPQTQKLTASNMYPSNNTAASTSLSQSSRSPSPPTTTMKSAMPKRRNTFNSREAAIEEALERGDVDALKKMTAGEDDEAAPAPGKRKRKRSGGTTAANADDAGSVKRKRSSPTPASVTSEKPNMFDVDLPGKEGNDGTASTTGSTKAESAAARRGGKRKKEKEPSMDIDDSASLAPLSQSANSKKHANQYTYRGKPQTSSANSPVKTGANNRAAGSAVPDYPTPSAQSTSSRKGGNNAGQSASKANQAVFASTSPHQPLHNSWNLPDHLSHLSDLLPAPVQGPIDVPNGHDEIIQERGAKVKWPQKRTTLGEMRRRVRAMLDYCTKAQADVSERAKRAAALEAFLVQAGELGLEGVGSGKGKNRSDAAIDCELVASITAMSEVLDPPLPASNFTAPRSSTGGPTTTAMDVSSMSTTELLASLTQDLLNFQERFGAGPGGKVYRDTAPRERRPRGAAAAAMLAMERSD